jgi:hypothetical protein
MYKIIVFFIAIIPLSLFAQGLEGFFTNKVKVHFSCYLPSDSINCDEMKDAFYKSNGGFVIASEADSFLTVTLRALNLNNSIEYQYSLEGKGELPQIAFKYPLNSSLSTAEKFEKVLSMMNKLVEPYKLITNYSTDSDSSRDKPYYASPQVGGKGSSGQGVQEFTGHAYVGGAYSTPKWRLVGDLGARYNYSSVETTAFAPGMNSKTFRQGGGVGIIRSFNKHWNIAVFASDVHVSTDINMEDPNHGLPENGLKNDARKTTIAAGVEWILIPFLTEKSNGNIAVRYILGGEHHKYVNPESFEYIQEEFAKHTLALVISKHFTKVDIDFTTSAFRSQFRENLNTALSGSSTVSYKVNKNITLDLSGGVEYAKGRIPSPAAGNLSFASLTNKNKSTVTYNGSVAVRLNLGNIRLKNSDQRFKDKDHR